MPALTVLQMLQMIEVLTHTARKYLVITVSDRELVEPIEILIETVQKLLTHYRHDELIELSAIGDTHAEAVPLIEAYVAHQAATPTKEFLWDHLQ